MNEGEKKKKEMHVQYANLQQFDDNLLRVFSIKENANTNRCSITLKLVFLKYNTDKTTVTSHIQIYLTVRRNMLVIAFLKIW